MCRLIASNLGEPVSASIDSLMKKLKVEMGKKSSAMLEKASASYSFDMEKEEGKVSANQRRLKVVQHALERKQSLKITHNDQDKSVRTIDPYGLHFRKGMWHVVAHDHRDDEIAYFALNRIRDIKETVRSYTIPVNFSLDDFVKTNPDKVYKEDLDELQQMLGWLDSYLLVSYMETNVGGYYNHWKKSYQKCVDQIAEIQTAINDRNEAISKFEQMKRKGEGIDDEAYLKLNDLNKADEIKLKKVIEYRDHFWDRCGKGKTKEEMENLLKEEEDRMNKFKVSEEFKEAVSRNYLSESKVKREEISREIEELKRRIAKGGD